MEQAGVAAGEVFCNGIVGLMRARRRCDGVAAAVHAAPAATGMPSCWPHRQAQMSDRLCSWSPELKHSRQLVSLVCAAQAAPAALPAGTVDRLM
ncbi:hypothetical protein CHLRE_13g584775v5 [Chlamydomonas reinhardtii]|uniref:Uncharacterized protein n=1 Tax=Chlamydomonas reinhardtii TaxID=3055 RepID=A0A2K3D0M8_CHLRE|nr:uncharacterized protein CHLRE_13g584775v5 [Chlamydomonas reinhardtii]PNW74086.1 hypothetical protein CHLRE_13g584775v5 [Chlamydomonas reinhardtii]